MYIILVELLGLSVSPSRGNFDFKFSRPSALGPTYYLLALNKIIICSIKPLKKWMAESAPLKKSSIIKDCMVQADPPKEANGEKNR